MDTWTMFVLVPHMFLTLDDNLFRTHALDNQVKTIRNCKADGEGHSAEAMADVLSRILAGLRFRCRAETQVASVENLLHVIFEGKSEEALNSCVAIADHGYWRDAFLQMIASFVLASMFVMPNHILRAHAFVPVSSLSP